MKSIIDINDDSSRGSSIDVNKDSSKDSSIVKDVKDFEFLAAEYLSVVTKLQNESIDLYNSLNKIVKFENEFVIDILNHQSENPTNDMTYLEMFRYLSDNIRVSVNCINRSNQILHELV